MLNICVRNGLSGSLTQWLQSRYHKELAKHKHGNNIKELALPFVHHVSNTKIQIYENTNIRKPFDVLYVACGQEEPWFEKEALYGAQLVPSGISHQLFFHDLNFFSRLQLFFSTSTFFHDFNFFSRPQLFFTTSTFRRNYVR